MVMCICLNDTATSDIYTYLHTLSLHDALPIWITSPWKWRHLKSVIVPSVQSPPSMLKLHDFCNRAILRIDIARNTAGSARPHIQSVRPGLHRQLYRGECRDRRRLDRKSNRLNSSHE